MVYNAEHYGNLYLNGISEYLSPKMGMDFEK
jgi:hypothetical protein